MSHDPFRIDSHKLIYHVHRVADWLDGKDIFPIYLEISPSGTCNHRCIFCSVDYLGYKKRLLDAAILRRELPEMGRLGIKSIMYAGEGEPLLHPDLPELITLTKASEIDVAITTNGVLLTPEKSEIILPATKWIKVSCNAGTPETYQKIHNSGLNDFNKLLTNLEAAVHIRQQQGSTCTLGIQIILLEENYHEVKTLALIARDIGLDYLVIKPYTRHRRNIHKRNPNYRRYAFLQGELSDISSENFQIIYRSRAIANWNQQKKSVDRCLALPFWAYIDSGANIRGCQGHLTNKNFYYGCLIEQNFEEIWIGEIRKKAVRWVENHFSTEHCKVNCRMDAVNFYLYELKNPGIHVNFI